MSGIYLLRDDGLVEMREAAYEAESVLQELLAKHQSLLAGDQLPGAEPRRWLFIRREVPVPAEQDGAGRWSLDHLFLDQDGVPTLVEVKRSSDTRIRREVVGQMLDYAANAVVYWPLPAVQAAFQGRCEREGLDPDAEVAGFLGPEEDVEEFWKRVDVNLQAGRVRLVFVADEIPAELRRVIEFLNKQMNPAEVLAIEVKQYVGEGLTTLVPRVIGQTAEAEARKRSGGGEGRRWDKESFLAELRDKAGVEAVAAATGLYDWAIGRGLRVGYGRGKVDGSMVPSFTVEGREYFPIALYTYGRVEIQFQFMTRPPFDDLALRRVLLRRINDVPGISLPEDSITRRPRVPLADLGRDPTMLKGLQSALDWFCDTARALPSVSNTSTSARGPAVAR